MSAKKSKEIVVSATQDDNSPNDAVKYIQKEHAAAQKAFTAFKVSMRYAATFMQHALNCGNRLIKEKDNYPHGELGIFFARCKIPARTAQNYMAHARRCKALANKGVDTSKLPQSKVLSLMKEFFPKPPKHKTIDVTATGAKTLPDDHRAELVERLLQKLTDPGTQEWAETKAKLESESTERLEEMEAETPPVFSTAQPKALPDPLEHDQVKAKDFQFWLETISSETVAKRLDDPDRKRLETMLLELQALLAQTIQRIASTPTPKE